MKIIVFIYEKEKRILNLKERLNKVLAKNTGKNFESIIKSNAPNQLTIKSGRNLFQMAYIDYDDIELMNLFIETKSKLTSN